MEAEAKKPAAKGPAAKESAAKGPKAKGSEAKDAEAETMRLTLRVWRQKDAKSEGRFVTYEASDVSEHMSFLEMLDVVNEGLIGKGEDPIAFDHDCREGICGTCGFVINGRAHGPRDRTTVCQLHMRSFKDGDVLTLEPWRAETFPVVRDLIVDRGAFDRIIAAGGYTSAPVGGAPDGNAIPVPKENADLAMDGAACIGCGACVAACPNASAMLFVSAKVSQLALLPQGQPERAGRARSMVARMDAEGFGTCTNHGECEAACPKAIRMEFIARLNADYMRASLTARRRKEGGGESAEE
jgi:succinate dehydrogenase / fumarate reductase iron-sulfur subunit